MIQPLRNEAVLRSASIAMLLVGAGAYLVLSAGYMMAVIVGGVVGVYLYYLLGPGILRIVALVYCALQATVMAVIWTKTHPIREIWPMLLIAAGLWTLCGALVQQRRRVPSSGSSFSGSTSLRRFQAARPRYSFADVVGMDDLKKQLLAAGREILTARKKSDPRNGILLDGDPGNGKTFIAEALAGELKLPFLTVTFGDVASRWMNQTTEQLMQAFDDALAQAPCLMFLDEIDSVLIRRENVVWAEAEAPRTVNAILTRLVDMRGKGVVIVAATNFIDQLDRAAIREGRFDYKIHVPCPDQAARAAIFQRTLSEKGMTRLAPGTVERAASRWEGFSAARIRAIAVQAGQIATEEGVQEIDFPLIQRALRKIQGSLGSAVRETDPTLDSLILAPQMAATLKGLATRMVNIEEVEGLGGSVPSGVLFYGPPGTGKTFTGKALARSVGWAFLPTTGQDLLSAPEKIDELLKKASDLRPCVVFIDEADDILGDRSMAPWAKAATNKLLSAIDGAEGKVKDVLFIAATNHPDTMDAAALRGGRFTEKVEFKLPDEATVSGFVREWMKTTKAPLAPGLSAEAVARAIGELSPANVKEILQAAVNHMIARRADGGDALVGMPDILEAKRTVLGY